MYYVNLCVNLCVTLQVAHLKESLERTIQEANEFRAEVTSLKLHLDRLKSKEASDTGLNISTVASSTQTEAQLLHDFTARNSSHPCTPDPCESVEVLEHISKSIGNASFSSEVDREDDRLKTNDSTPICQHCSEKQVVVASFSLLLSSQSRLWSDWIVIHQSLLLQELETVHILAEALPKIVPYVLINHREVSLSQITPFCLLISFLVLPFNIKMSFLRDGAGASSSHDLCN